MKAINAAVREFHEFHRLEGRGPGLVLTRNPARAPRSSHSYLAHVDKRALPEQSRLVRRAKTSAVPLIDFEADFGKLLKGAATARDRLLLSADDASIRVGDTGTVENNEWMERLGIPITSASSRFRFHGLPHGTVLGGFLNLSEVLEHERRDYVDGIVVVPAHGKHELLPTMSGHAP